MKSKTVSYYIREFLTTYLVTRRNCSQHTVSSYRDTIKLFLNYNVERNNIKIEKIDFNILTYENVNLFLDYLQSERNISSNSRNQRLACLKSLCKYIVSYEPIYLEQFGNIINIKAKKCSQKSMCFFKKEEIKQLLEKPNTKSKQGIKDLIIMVLLYDTAIRVSELINLKIDDVLLDSPSRIIIKKGKGNKSREIPLMNDTVKILKEYMAFFKLESGNYLIKSNQNKKYSSNGIRKVIQKYTKNFNFKVTPHTFRRSKASHLVEANVPLIYIRDFLGHENIETTEIYTKINNNIKDNIIKEKSIKLDTTIKYNMDEDNDIVDWLIKL